MESGDKCSTQGVFSLERGFVIGAGCDGHAESSAEHRCDGSGQKSSSGIKILHAIHADIDYCSHDNNKKQADLILWDDELVCAILDDLTNLNRSMRVSLVKHGSLNVYLLQFRVVEVGPNEAHDRGDYDKSYDHIRFINN